MGVVQNFCQTKVRSVRQFLPISDHGSRPVRPPFPPEMQANFLGFIWIC
jgi:hypothetical protein